MPHWPVRSVNCQRRPSTAHSAEAAAGPAYAGTSVAPSSACSSARSALRHFAAAIATELDTDGAGAGAAG